MFSLHRMREEAKKKEVSASFLIRRHCTKVKQGTYCNEKQPVPPKIRCLSMKHHSLQQSREINKNQ